MPNMRVQTLTPNAAEQQKAGADSSRLAELICALNRILSLAGNTKLDSDQAFLLVQYETQTALAVAQSLSGPALAG